VNVQVTASAEPTVNIEDLCHAVAEASPYPVAAVVGTGHIVQYVNPAFCLLVDKPREELIGNAFLDVVAAGEVCMTLLDKVTQTGKAETHDGQKGSVENPLRWSYAMWPILGAHDRTLGMFIRVAEATPLHEDAMEMNQALLLSSVHQYDLREEAERMNTQLQTEILATSRAQEALIRIEKLASVGRMAATVAHEINNPLEAVMNTLYLAQTTEGLPPSARQYLDIAEGELKRIAHITRQTLGFYRESSGPTRFCIAPVLDSVIDLLQAKIKAKRATVERQCDERLEMTGISGELRQVFANLVLNSLDAIDEKGTVRLRVSASSRYGDGDRYIRVTVADNGQGIDAATRLRIFEPFFTTKGSVGNGLGLWVCKQIVDKHNGFIRVRSSRNGTRRGATFTVVLPAAPVPRDISS
jgi:two-component system, NtrC family, sensor kinase